MFKYRIFALVILLTSTNGLALNTSVQAEHPYQVEWITQIGTNSSERGYSVDIDQHGNAYISGMTGGNYAGPSFGSTDAFVTKVAPTGGVIWSKLVGTDAMDISYGMATDITGNVYISGFTKGDLGNQNAGDDDAFLSKLDPMGNILWSRQIGGPGTDRAMDVTVDSAGNAYITGHTRSELGADSFGVPDTFITKYSSSGDLQWTKQIGTTYFDFSWAVAADGTGNTYIVGRTEGSFVGGSSAGFIDAFLIKLDPHGDQLWARQIDSSTNQRLYDEGWSVAVDDNDNVYITGVTRGDLGSPNAGFHDAYLIKFDSRGNQLWSEQIGTGEFDFSYSVAIDTNGNAFITGQTMGDIGSSNAGEEDAFLVKYDPSGNRLWTQQLGTTSTDVSWSVATDSSGNVYMTGYTEGKLGTDQFGFEDVFLAKFIVPEPTSATAPVLAILLIMKRIRTNRYQLDALV